MANIFDYLSWRGDIGFDYSPFNPVDNIIFCQLSYLPLDGIVGGPEERNWITIARAAEIFAERLRDDTSAQRQATMFKDDPAFLSALGSSNRFKNCVLRGYVNQIDVAGEKQFSALSITGLPDECFIAYRGTDANFVSWKEDLNMSFSDAVPAQLEAVSYLEKMAGKLKGPLLLGGHSKGGNLAVYAASFCDKKIHRRIAGIYSNDAPGFQRRVIESEGYQAVREHIRSFIPQSSVVGMLLEHGAGYSVIKSSQSGLLQHDLYSWETSYNDLVHADRVTQGSLFIDKTLSEWINNLDYDSRQKFIEALYTILTATQVQSIPELTSDWFKAAGRMIQSLGNIDESTKTLIRKTLAALFQAARNNINTLLKPQTE
ncbi:MAG: DUF2974 domain-containing protein [Treponema sp.]|jgi:hypothetical protein|nr:DUF2974 domain-containing protein [Treponema sp.]